MMKKTKLLLIPIASAFLFSACITKEQPALTTYSLSDNINYKTNKSISNEATIRVYEPKAIASINSKNLLYTKENLQYEKYALSKWSDRSTKMIQNLITDSLNKSKNYKYVTSSNIKLNSDYKLLSEIVDLKQEFIKNESFSKFSIRVYLVDNKTNKTYFESFDYRLKTKSNDAQGFVKVLNIQINNFLKDLNIFITKSISR